MHGIVSEDLPTRLDGWHETVTECVFLHNIAYGSAEGVHVRDEDVGMVIVCDVCEGSTKTVDKHAPTKERRATILCFLKDHCLTGVGHQQNYVLAGKPS
jgi:hypothetical protein